MSENRYDRDLKPGSFSEQELEQKILSRSTSFKVPAGISAEEAYARFRTRIASGSHEQPSGKKAVVRRLVYAIASAAALVVVITVLWFLYSGRNMEEVTAEAGTHAEHRLPDGSHVIINAGSSIRYDRHSFAAVRKLNLEGEAFFNVVKGNSFQISTTQADIFVLGTSFNVYSRYEGFRVTCITGMVRVIAEDITVDLTPGESAEIESNKLVSYSDKKPETSTDWTKGEFSYDNSSLIQVLNEMERQFNVKFVAGDLADRHFTGSFTNNDLKNALDIVCIPMGLTYEIGNKGKILIREKIK